LTREARTRSGEPEATPSEPDAAQILASVGEAAYAWRIDSDQLTWAGSVADVLKVDDASAVASGRAYARLVESTGGVTRYEAVVKSTHTDSGAGVPYQIEYCFRPSLASDLRFWIEDNGRWFAGPDGKPLRAQGVIRVINERHARDQQLAFLAYSDGLTGELNRWRLMQVLLRTLDEAVRLRASCGFMLIGIDNLARLNEAYGYAVVDEIIGAVAKRLRTKMRGRDSLGRYSGNKFGVVLAECTPEEMTVAADRLLAGVRDELIPTSAGPLAVTITIGGITAPRHARTVEEILSRAYDALSAARAKRRGSFMAYQPNPEREALRRASVRATDEIVAALNDRRILLAFEPVVDATSRVPAFYECLMRVKRADGSLAPTHEIVAVAEKLGMIRLLDHRVLEMVVAELVAAPQLKCSVNVSPDSTMDPDWAAGLTALLRANAGVAERLIVEITETAAIHDVDDTRGFITRLKDLGCRIAIDDFGAGNTSFRNLRRLGVDIVKIDGAFVQSMLKSPDDCAFVQTMIDLAHRLDVKTVAEWVQDEEAAAMLAGWSCDYLQGALIGLASTESNWTQRDDRVAS